MLSPYFIAHDSISFLLNKESDTHEESQICFLTLNAFATNFLNHKSKISIHKRQGFSFVRCMMNNAKEREICSYVFTSEVSELHMSNMEMDVTVLLKVT